LYVGESRQIVRSICGEVPAGSPIVIGGDFNFKSFGQRLASEQPTNDSSEVDALREFRDLGLFVAWRDVHSDLPLPQTLRWNGAPATPYHCDGFLFRGMDVHWQSGDCVAQSAGTLSPRLTPARRRQSAGIPTSTLMLTRQHKCCIMGFCDEQSVQAVAGQAGLHV
jgi:hypothetical protein